jgi:tripartite-type tricarboxylate transporter receptor subunit TctC
METAPMKVTRALLLLVLAAVLPAAKAQAEKWPEKPVRMVVPFAPGGGTDIVARMIAVRLSEEFGQHFVVDNRAGAGGLIGTEIVARAAPDGYTMIMVSTSYSANPALYKLSYDPVKGIAPISLVAAGPLILVVHPSLKANDLKEFLALARARPGTLNFGSSGTGGSIHLAFELLRQMTQTDMQHIPYKGTGPAMADLLGGQIQFMLSSAPAAIPQVKAGKLRALAVTTPKRSPLMPELPAIGEQVPGFEYSSWYGMWTAADTPKEIVLRLNHALARILERTDVQERLRADGVEPAHSTPEEFARLLAREIATWKKVVEVGKIRVN